MNLITVHMEFDAKVCVNGLSPNARSLWLAFVQVANRAHWPELISLPASSLMVYSGIGNKDALYSARNELKQKGFMDYKEGRGSQSAKYWFVSDIQTQTATQSTTQTATQTPSQSTPIYIKEKNIKENKKSSGSLDTLWEKFIECSPQQPPPPSHKNEIKKYLDKGFTEKELLYAFERANKAISFHWGYINSVLEGERNGTKRPVRGQKKSGGVQDYGQRDAESVDLALVASKLIKEGAKGESV